MEKAISDSKKEAKARVGRTFTIIRDKDGNMERVLEYSGAVP